MFSKRALVTSTVLGLLFLVGCGLYTGEKSPKRTPPSYSGQGFSCVGRIPEHFDKYVNDQLSNEEITSFVSCLQKAFTTFAQLTRGRNATTYGPDEIRDFLHEFFLGDRRISDDLMHEFMVLKQAMVGGELNVISRAELYVAVEILDELRTEAIKLKPYLRVLNPRLAKKQDPSRLGERLIEANEALNSSIQAVTKRLERNKRSYTLARLEKFMAEFREFVGWESHFPKAVSAPKWIRFLRSFRDLTLAPDNADVVQADEWAPMLQSIASWYLVYLKYEVGIKERPVLQGVGLQNTVQLGQEIFSLLEKSIERQENRTISFAQMNEMTGALHQLGWIPEHIHPASITSALSAFVTRMLGDPDVPASQRKSSGLGHSELPRARVLFSKWFYVQLNLDSRHKVPGGADQPVVPNIQIRPYLSPNVRPKLKGFGPSDWDEFLKLRSLMRPLFAKDGYRVMLVRKEDLARHSLRHTFHNLSLMNLARSVTSLIFLGYAEQAGSRLNWEAGITSSEMQKFYEDFRALGIDLRWVDSRNKNTGARSFIEGNLFTYAADGFYFNDDSPRARMNFIETMELFSFLYSGGKMALEFYEKLKELCKAEKLGPADLAGRPTIARECVLDELPSLFDKFLVNMPELQQFLRLSSPAVRGAFARTLLETAFSPVTSSKQWVELNELSIVAVVLHYSEAVMTRYDENGDGILTNPEIEAAAKNFTGYIKKFAKDKKNEDLSDRQAKGAFYYILKNREMPEGWTDIIVPSYFRVGAVSLNRSDLSAVFLLIIRKILDAEQNPRPAPEVPEIAVPCSQPGVAAGASCFSYPISP